MFWVETAEEMHAKVTVLQGIYKFETLLHEKRKAYRIRESSCNGRLTCNVAGFALLNNLPTNNVPNVIEGNFCSFNQCFNFFQFCDEFIINQTFERMSLQIDGQKLSENGI